MGRPPGPVLVTGCSTGIGRAVALRLARDGHVVHATARRPDTLTDLEAAGCSVGPLDVVDPESAAAAVDTVMSRHGRVGGLVSNAGYAEYGPLEEVPLTAAPQSQGSPYGDLTRSVETSVRGLLVTIRRWGGDRGWDAFSATSSPCRACPTSRGRSCPPWVNRRRQTLAPSDPGG